MTKKVKDHLRLYFISSSNPGLGTIETALKSGVTMFQLREKGDGALTGDALIDFAHEIKGLTDKYNVPFIINDDAALAEHVEADGIHLGQDDMKPSDLPDYFDDKIIGLSVADKNELLLSDITSVDYIGTGPVFETQSKSDAGKAIGGLGLRNMRQAIGELPMVAIGGITQDNYQECLENGADGIAVISAISEASDTKEAVQKFI